jgi:hypothetical protein
MNLFALVKEHNQTVIKRIPLSQDIQEAISNFYSGGLNDLIVDKELITFNGNFKPDRDQLFYIDNYPFDAEIVNSNNNPLAYDILNVENFEGNIFAVYTNLVLNGTSYYLFQHFDTRKIISNRGISLYFNQDTYTKIDKRGISISGNLTAVFTNNQLFFNSYFNTKKIFNLSDYYQEATATDINAFKANALFSIENNDDFDLHLNSTNRKKIKSIQLSGVLNGINVQNIIASAAEFGINLTSDDNDRLNIPNDKNAIKDLLRFLDEDYFITPITSTRCMTNSKITI